MSTIDLAIVIPTLNEEKYIGPLLDSIIAQTVTPKEVVIVDAFSNDKTIDEIKKRQVELPQLKYYQIEKDTISRQRNLGVQKTKAANILFLDADMYFKEADVLEKYFKEAVESNADFAISTILPLSNKKRDHLLYFVLNTVPKISKPFKYYATTMNLFIKREIFEQVGGFDEEIRVAEDFEFISRLKKSGAKFVILNKPKIHNSVRRLDKEGRIRWNFILLTSLLFVLIVGYKKNPIAKRYKLGEH